MRYLTKLLAFALRLAIMCGVGVLALVRGLYTGLVFVMEVVRSLRRLARGLRCPRGHLVPTEGATYSCNACGYTYEGQSQWLCPNAECRAPSMYVNCPTCGLSVPSPYRFLHK